MAVEGAGDSWHPGFGEPQLTDSVQADRSYCKAAMVVEGAGKERQAENHIEDVEVGGYSCCCCKVVVEQVHHKSPQYHNQGEPEAAAAAVGCHYYTLGMIER